MADGTEHRGEGHWAADEIVAPALLALKAVYDEVRGNALLAAYSALPPVETLPGLADLAMVEVDADRRFPYQAMGEGYRRTAAIGGSGLQPGPDGRTFETRPVIRQHFGLALSEARPFHVSVTRWDGPKILQFDRLILPLDDGRGEITHLLVGEVFLRVAKDA
ncbi:hypothetical protein [Ferrovibrio xuzhouensis]|uniref:PAS domain-containing protein n=1 Tax=Ferrovibrio xuzhouensis TaxID=1576914 RepID=A0ABV7VH11_9PROT